MKKITFIYVLLLSIYSFGQQTKKTQTAFGKPISAEAISPSGHVRCISTEYEEYLKSQDPKKQTAEEFEAWIAPIIAQYRAVQQTGSQSGGIITIPVVVHVIHSGQPVGTAPNITDAQVQSQITVMNNDFRRLAGTPGFNNNPVGADTQIQFALAQMDPDGNPTNGINRVNLCEASWSTTDINGTVKPNTIWNPNDYMNMWSVNFTDGTLLGYAQFPIGSGLQGLPTTGGAFTDGVVANYSTFGSIDYNDGSFLLNPPYNKGRTMTHEVGHFLGLRHIWGDGGCDVDDFCADTPNAGAANFGCPTGTNSCTGVNNPGNDMIENYMDYTDDACMNIYTVNQKERITAVMNNSPRRTTLKTSTKDLPMTLFANDAQVYLEPTCAGSGSCSTAITQKVTIYNRGTNVLTAATIEYSIAGGPQLSYNWTGSLPTHGFQTFDMPVTATQSGSINIGITSVNGGADQRATNNQAFGDFELPVVPPSYATAQVTLTLQRDLYGSETTWNLKNSAGAIIAQGGPYGNASGTTLPALINQNINVANNTCYIFTINDSVGDGICCAYGVGYYTLKTSSNVVIYTSPFEGGSTESTSFVVGSLGAEDFDLLSRISLYPNPTKDIINIGISNELELPTSYVIYNAIGQEIQKRNIQSNEDLSISTANMNTGVYFIKIIKNNETKTLQFIKN